LDLSKVDEIDLSGLQILYAMRKTFEAEGVFHIRAVSEAVRETIALSGYGRFFKEVVS
ncbi:MAG: STAS domain-containing protein, partial [Desulfomonilia bacterium]